MPLNLDQVYKGAIVDRNVEWGEDGKERSLNPIMRGIIVKVDGDPASESVKGLFVCFGPGEKKEVKDLAKKIKPVEVTVNGITVTAFPIKAAELNVYIDHEDRRAREAWNRLFQIPVNVGMVFDQRVPKSSRKRKTLDMLNLTPTQEEGPVKDEVQMNDAPASEEGE